MWVKQQTLTRDGNLNIVYRDLEVKPLITGVCSLLRLRSGDLGTKHFCTLRQRMWVRQRQKQKGLPSSGFCHGGDFWDQMYHCWNLTGQGTPTPFQPFTGDARPVNNDFLWKCNARSVTTSFHFPSHLSSILGRIPVDDVRKPKPSSVFFFFFFLVTSWTLWASPNSRDVEWGGRCGWRRLKLGLLRRIVIFEPCCPGWVIRRSSPLL